MVKFFVLFLFFYSINNVFAQFSGRNIISTSVDYEFQIDPLDYDSDGLIDIIGSYGTLYRFDGVGFEDTVNIGCRSYGFDLADINSDSELDIVFANYNNSSFDWKLNLLGSFNAGVEIHNVNSPSYDLSVLSFDVDGDENNDIIFGVDGELSVIYGDGVGEFGESIVEAQLPSGYLKIDHADIDGDSYQDLFVLSSSMNTLFVMMNYGFGLEDTIRLVSDVNQFSDFCLFDANNDGLIDIGIATFGKVRISLNNGDGTFSESLLVDENIYSIFGMKSIDYDKDGDNDLIVLDAGRSRVLLYTNNDGDFSSMDIIDSDIQEPVDVIVSDFDKDGKEDIAVSSFEMLSWYRNEFVQNEENTISELIDNSVNIYPNPVSSILNIELDEVEKGLLTIFDFTGRNLLKSVLYSKINSIDISYFNPGLYTLQIKSEKGSVIRKLVVK